MSADRFSTWDAAYVLGALSEDDRVSFEQHLAGCADCSAAVASLRPMPDLLALLDAQALAGDASTGAAAAAVGAPPPDTLLPSLLHRVRAERRRRWLVSGLVAAAIAALVIGAGALVLGRDASSSGGRTMTALVAAPIRATAEVRDVQWGTRITLHCTYDGAATSRYTDPSSRVYGLRVTDRSGHTQELGMWSLTPGRQTTFTSGTALARSEIAKIDITTANGVSLLTLAE